MRCMTCEDKATRRALPAGPRIICVVRSVREAAGVLGPLGPDEVLFEELPADLGHDRGLPVTVQMPFASAALARARTLFPRLRMSVEGARIEERKVHLRILSAAGIAGVVPDLFTLPVGETIALVELFLHDPGIGAPIEPAATLLAATLARRNCSLWDLCGPGPRARVFVDGTGRAAATLADLRDGRFLGAAGDGPEAWRVSRPWRALDQFQRALPHAHPECLECRSFGVCQGWGAWAGACAQANAALGCIADAARELGREAQRDRLQAGGRSL